MKLQIKILFLAFAILPVVTGSIPLNSKGRPDDKGSPACGNFIVINGESNINKFSFSYIPSLINNDSRTNKTENEKIDLKIPVRMFKPSNPGMYDDFLTLLNAEEYPYFRISLLPGDPGRDGNLSFPDKERISVTLAGVTREYSVDCTLTYCNDRLILKGEQTVRLTDFKLTPPVRLKGIVKVENEVSVNFGFILNFTDEQSLSILK